MQITLSQFEQIDSLMSDLLRMGEFEDCADPRGYIRTSNRLFDACVEATSLAFASDYASALECAAEIITAGLLGTMEVLDTPSMTYRNGRWGSNTARVSRCDGGWQFCDGYGDPWFCKTHAQAVEMFESFIADKEPA